MMTRAIDSPANRQQIDKVRTALATMLTEVLRRGFHGTAAIEVSVQDGTVQHIRRRTERIER